MNLITWLCEQCCWTLAASVTRMKATLIVLWRAGVMASALRSNVNVVPVARYGYD